MGVKIDFSQHCPTPLGAIDTQIMRNELENATANTDDDMAYEMGVALAELPLLAELGLHLTPCVTGIAEAMAAAWEGGRRYGLVEAMSQITNVIDHTGPQLVTAADPAPVEVPLLGYIDGAAQIHFEHQPSPRKPVRGVFYISELPDDEAEALARATVSQVLSFHQHSRRAGCTAATPLPVAFPDASDEWQSQRNAAKAAARADFNKEPPPPLPTFEPFASDFQRGLRESASADPANSGDTVQ
jgi:hypothetical protein